MIARHTYKVEQIANLLKGEATKQLKQAGLHPLSEQIDTKGRMPTPWAHREWKVFLDSEEAIENAIRYVEENPIKEEQPTQKWSFVTPFAGLDPGWISYHEFNRSTGRTRPWVPGLRLNEVSPCRKV